MTAEEFFVYRELCPTEYKIDSYSRSPIPLRVLQVAVHAKSLGLFRCLEVWDREDVTIKDPVLVGIVGDPQYSWSVKARYILARWGDELEPFAVLVKRAVERWRGRSVEAAEGVARRITSDIATIQSLPMAEMLQRGPGYTPEFKI